MSSRLDQQQIFQQLYDSDENRLRVDTGAVFTFSGEMEVSIDSLEDSITIGDESGNKAVVVGNALKVDGSAVTQPVSGTITANAGSGTFTTKVAAASGATVNRVSSSTSNTTLLASNTSRRMATFYNDSTANCYLKFGATASVSSFTIKVAAGGYYELPLPIYTGIIDGIWDSVNGGMQVTEIS